MESLRNKRLSGEWWTAEDPAHRYRGILTIDDEHHGELVLRGSESELAFLPMSPAIKTIHGQLADRYGYEVTLLQPLLKQGPNSTYPKDPTRETAAHLVTNELLVGCHIASIDTPAFSGLIARLTGLADWCDATGFAGAITRFDEGDLPSESVEVSFRETATAFIDVGGGRQLRFLSEYDGPRRLDGQKHVVLRERNTLNVLFHDLVSTKDILAEATIWRLFLTLGLRHPSYVDEITILISTGGDTFTRAALLVPGRRTEAAHKRRDRRDLLFTQSSLGEQIGARLAAWRKTYSALEPAILLYGGAAYQDANYLHANLLSYLQALEVLHRSLFDTDRFPSKIARQETLKALRAAIPQTLGPALIAALSAQLGFVGVQSLYDRLTYLFHLYPKTLTPLFQRGDEDMKQLRDVRNYLTHYAEHKKRMGPEFLWSREVHTLREKSRLFMEVCLLGTLGMSDEEIAGLMSHFEPYASWKMETSIERFNATLAGKAGEGNGGKSPAD